MTLEPSARIENGAPDIAKALELVEQAVMIKPNPWFVDIDSLRRYLEDRRDAKTSQQ
jgi:hypothetical protein